jgi:hypothetical protein
MEILHSTIVDPTNSPDFWKKMQHLQDTTLPIIAKNSKTTKKTKLTKKSLSQLLPQTFNRIGGLKDTC